MLIKTAYAPSGETFKFDHFFRAIGRPVYRDQAGTKLVGYVHSVEFNDDLTVAYIKVREV
jgi:hypothetical protein